MLLSGALVNAMIMTRSAMWTRWIIGLTLALLALRPASAELYKCLQPDGRLSYQQTACAPDAAGARLQVDTRGPDGREQASSAAEEYAVESQAEWLRSEREAQEAVLLEARQAAEARHAAQKAERQAQLDPAKCARHRAEAAKWREKARGTYRTRAEQEQNDNRLAHHQALIEQYCD